MGCYISPYNASTIEDIIASIRRRPQGAELLVAGNFRTDMANPEVTMRVEDISAVLAAAGLKYMSTHFLPRINPWLRDRYIWSMRSGYRVVCSRTDYLLGTDRRLYQNMLFWDVHHNLDHYLVLGCLWGAPAREHVRYLGNKSRFPPLTTAK